MCGRETCGTVPWSLRGIAMATPNEKLAAALEELRQLQATGARVFESGQLGRTSRERLVDQGFLQEVMRGWLLSSSPAAQPGDTTPWFASFWEFCRRYCDRQLGEAWHLSPEQSLLIHGENTVIPTQVVVYSTAANNNRIDLLFGTSLFALKQKAMPPARDLEVVTGLRVFRAEAALLRVSAEFFVQHPVEAQVVLGGIREASALLSRLLSGGHAVIAGRLAAAFRRLGQGAIADEIVATMKAADHDVREADPFEVAAAPVAARRGVSPIVARLRTLWASSRAPVLAECAKLRRQLGRATEELRRVDGVYQLDAYHSLSIEGYQVTPALVQRVATGSWEPDRDPVDRETANALAARGYWLAFQRVRETTRGIVAAKGDPRPLRAAHRDWYRELFSPHVAAGVLAPAMLAGYRDHLVYLRGSRHVPPRAEVVRDAMPALFDLIEQEPEPAVRAVLGHWLFGYVHPFPDGNGRIARFLMNSLLVAGGYPWTVIRVEQRDEYLAALETASVAGDVRPFTEFVVAQLRQMPRVAKPRRPKRPAARRRGSRSR